MSEVMKILIAVACIIALVYLGFRLFGITTQDTEIEQAKASLEQIVRVIDSLEDGEEKNHIIETRSGESWLVYFGDYQNNKLLCICLESNSRKDCVDEALGICKQTGYVFKMLTPGLVDIGIQYIKLNEILVDVEINKYGNIINIVKSLVKVEGTWEKFSSAKPEEACPQYVGGIREGYYLGVEDVLEFDNIEELIVNLPVNYKEDLYGKFYPKIGFLKECMKEFQRQENEIFGVRVIFPEEDGQIPEQFVFNPLMSDAPLPDVEDYWETTLTSEDGKTIIIKIYPKELFES